MGRIGHYRKLTGKYASTATPFKEMNKEGATQEGGVVGTCRSRVQGVEIYVVQYANS